MRSSYPSGQKKIYVQQLMMAVLSAAFVDMFKKFEAPA